MIGRRFERQRLSERALIESSPLAMKRSPSLASLKLFLKIGQLQSFSETARVCNVSQPALSRTIRILEDDLGVRLFDRNSRNVELTSAGQLLRPIVERLADDFDAAFDELAQSFAGQRGRVVLGALPSVAAHGLPMLVAEFLHTHPNVEVVINDTISGTLYQQLADRQIDFAIVTPPDDPRGYAFETVYEDECVLVARDADIGGFAEPVSWSVFTQHPFVAMASRSSVRLLTDGAFVRADVRVKPLFECTQLATVGGLISAGLGISALPLSTVPMLDVGGRVAWRRLAAPRAVRTIGIARVANRSLPPAADALLGHLLKRRDVLSA